MSKTKIVYDAIVIGGGIIGGAINYELAKYDLNILALEKNALLADETTRGNSGVIHGGFDAESHKIEARLNVLGNELWRTRILKDLIIPHAQIDSLVIAFNETELKHVHELYERGITNGVEPKFMRIISKEELLKREPNLNNKVVGALLCTSSVAIDPVKATHAFFGAAKKNGLTLKYNAEVIAIVKEDDLFKVIIKDGSQFYSKNIINAAGHYADKMAELANLQDFKQMTRRGEYIVLSRNTKVKVNSICFMVPTIHGKGVIVAPMLDGRTLVGPTAEENVTKEDTRFITSAKHHLIEKIGIKLIPDLEFEKTEIRLSGSRPIDIETNDFVLRYAKKDNHFINAGGMQSPGISSAPAIALEIVELLKNNGTMLIKKDDFDPKFEVIW